MFQGCLSSSSFPALAQTRSSLLASRARRQHGAACLPAACKQGAVSPRWFLCKVCNDTSAVGNVVPERPGRCPCVPARPYSTDALLLPHTPTQRNWSRSGV